MPSLQSGLLSLVELVALGHLTLCLSVSHLTDLVSRALNMTFVHIL